MSKVETLLAMAYAMHDGDAMLRRYAARQGWRSEAVMDAHRTEDAARFVVAAGRDWHDVLRAAS